MDNLVGIR